MKVWVRSSSGLELEIVREDGMSPDGLDTLLRQVADTFQVLIAIELDAGLGIGVGAEVETPEWAGAVDHETS